MGAYVLRRTLQAIPILLVISVIAFAIIHLPPVSFLDLVLTQWRNLGIPGAEVMVQDYKVRFGLDKPLLVQYFMWIGSALRGDFGISFMFERPVGAVIGERLALSMSLALMALVVSYVIAIPIGVYCATHQYSWGDYLFSFIAFVGASIPPFMIALIVMFVAVIYGDISVGGLFSPEYVDKPWSWGRLIDFFKHLWLPVVIIALSTTAGKIRIMRANLLDVLGHQFVTTARAKGVHEPVVVYKHAARVAINPIISGMALEFPTLVEGEGVTAIVMSLPTIGPVYLQALTSVDTYLAATIFLFLAAFAIIGGLVSDILLGFVDPRIRFA